MSEVSTWDQLREKLKARAELGGIERITEKLNDGVPDTVYQFVSGEAGWLELKFMGKVPGSWPVVRIPWKSAAQPFWLQRWVRWGGRSGVLLHVKDDASPIGWYYWRPTVNIDWIRWIQTPVAVSTATWQCGPRLDVDGLLKALH